MRESVFDGGEPNIDVNVNGDGDGNACSYVNENACNLFMNYLCNYVIYS
jgi:hypothetical protein